jgi:dTDP-4-amino-4,6-dideoxygalactose transaminase
MTEWQAAILLAQLTRLEELAACREENALYLAAELAQIQGINPQKRDPRVTQHAYHLFIFRYDPDAFSGMTRDEFLVALGAEGIPCARGYTPLYKTLAIQSGTIRLQKFTEGREVAYHLPDCPVTERACEEEGVWLSQRVLLGDRADMDDIIAAVRKIQRAAAGRAV